MSIAVMCSLSLRICLQFSLRFHDIDEHSQKKRTIRISTLILMCPWVCRQYPYLPLLWNRFFAILIRKKCYTFIFSCGYARRTRQKGTLQNYTTHVHDFFSISICLHVLLKLDVTFENSTRLEAQKTRAI